MHSACAPAKRQMARRLAESGYSVLVVNQYYRSQRAPIVNTTNFADVSDTLRPLMGNIECRYASCGCAGFYQFPRQSAVRG